MTVICVYVPKGKANDLFTLLTLLQRPYDLEAIMDHKDTCETTVYRLEAGSKRPFFKCKQED